MHGDPTAEAHLYWSRAFDFWNEALFEGALPRPVITLSRTVHCMGYFRARAMANRAGETVHEIAMNPRYFHLGDKETHGTFVHELAHHWREVLGPLNAKGGKGAGGYHDIVWAYKMEELGLFPSDTGRPGGKRTGYSVSHYIVPGGRFESVFDGMAGDDSKIEWHDCAPLGMAKPQDEMSTLLDELGFVEAEAAGNETQAENTKAAKDRIKFSCACGLNAWAKPSAKLVCGFCSEPMPPAQTRA